MIKAIRGTRDLLPPETALWNYVEDVAREVFRAYNFGEIRTPIFEETQLFARSVGEETDIVSKEMYTWEDRGRFDAAGFIEFWKALHFEDFDRFEDIRGREAAELGIDLVAYREGEPTVVIFQIGRLGRATLARVHASRKMFERTAGRMPKAIIVVPLSFRRPTKTLDLSEVTIEYLDDSEFHEWGESLTLRPENTAGVVRAYIEHKLWERPGVQKLYYMGPQFRRERPQKGRYRQFYQIGAEMIGPPAAGSESPARDAEMLEMLATLLDRLGLENWTLQLNSVGCPNDRPRYHDALRQALAPHVAKMCADCQRRAVTNPLRVLDCKVEADQPIIEKLPRIADYLDNECRQKFHDLLAILRSVGVPYHLNSRLVRGLDYYTRTAFEFTHGALGAQNAIIGGGRYDGLSEALGGPKAPGIGFAIGEDRLVSILEQAGKRVDKSPDAYIAPIGVGMNIEAAKLARNLRRNDLVIELGDRNFRLRKSLEVASKIGARFVVIVGEDEVRSGEYVLRDMEGGIQIKTTSDKLVEYLKGKRPLHFVATDGTEHPP